MSWATRSLERRLEVLRYEKAACNETDFHDWVEQLVETKQREPVRLGKQGERVSCHKGV